MFGIICLNSIYGQNKEVAVLQPRVIGGGTVSTNDQLIISSSMKKAFTQLNGYEAFTRTSQSLIAAEQAFQHSGQVDDNQIKEVGRQTGVAYICVFTLSKENNELVVNSDIINVVTGKIENSDFIVLNENDRNSVMKQCQELAYNLLGASDMRSNSSNLKTNSNKDGVTIDGVTWAKKNVGAFYPENSGDYYDFEQAKRACPKGWRLPTVDECKKLINSGSTLATLNGIDGRKFGDANNYIFLPAAGGINIDGSRDNRIFNGRPNGLYYAIAGDEPGSLSFWGIDPPSAYFYNKSLVKYKNNVRCVAE